jgi:hypothetical protein
MAFPRDAYKAFLTTLFPPGCSVLWKGEPEVFLPPLEGYDTPVTVRLDVGDSYGYGTSEVRKCWDNDAQDGDGAWKYYTLQRMTWPLTIDVETLSSESPGEDFMMIVRNKIRWASSILAIQNMGLTTIRVGNILSEVRNVTGTPNVESFGAVLQITHGQCFALLEEDNDGSVIDTVTSIPGTVTGGQPTPVTLDAGPVNSD